MIYIITYKKADREGELHGTEFQKLKDAKKALKFMKSDNPKYRFEIHSIKVGE